MIAADLFEERAAIIEHHGGFTKSDAEQLARHQLFRRVLRRPTQNEKPVFLRLGWSIGKQIRFLNRG